MQRTSIKTCSTNNSRQRKPRMSKKIRVTLYLQLPEILQADRKKLGPLSYVK